MKVELIHFYIKKEYESIYSGVWNNNSCAYTEDLHCLGIYAGEDDEHIWILPLYYGYVQNDDGTPQTKNRIIIGSVARFVKDTIVITEPEDHVSLPFADMIYGGGSAL